MNGIDELMLNKITKEEFLKINKISEIDIEIEKGLMKAFYSKSPDQLEIIIYLIFKFEIFNKKYINIFNELLVSNWHYQHENIILILQKLSVFDSIKYIFDAIDLQMPYLLKDENNAFGKKCVRAIYYIGKDKAFPYLKILCEHPNSIISELAQRKIKELK